MTELVERCRAFRAGVMAERESLKAEKAGLLERISGLVAENETAIVEKVALIEEKMSLIAERSNLLAERESLSTVIERLRSITLWAELASGAAVKVGDEVRYFGKEYRCVKEHTKALLRSPLNAEYWESLD